MTNNKQFTKHQLAGDLVAVVNGMEGWEVKGDVERLAEVMR